MHKTQEAPTYFTVPERHPHKQIRKACKRLLEFAYGIRPTSPFWGFSFTTITMECFKDSTGAIPEQDIGFSRGRDVGGDIQDMSVGVLDEGAIVGCLTDRNKS